MSSDEELIRAFLAKKTVQKVEEGIAFGVDPAEDQKKRAAAKAAKCAKRWDEYDSADVEYRAEEYRERVNDAYMSGGSRARDAEMAAGPNWRLSRDRTQYEDGPLTRRVKLNRY